MTQANNPLHGIKLETIVTDLVERYGWEELGQRIKIRCFTHDPSIKSSLRFLRKTDWAREKVEYLYLKAHKLPLPAPKAAQAKSSQPQQMNTVNDPQVASNGEPTALNSHIWGNRG